MSTPALIRLIAAAPLLVGAGLVIAQGQQKTGTIYSCEVNGKKITQDRPIPECVSREQIIHNGDGSVRGRLPPTMTADERAELEARQQQDALAAKIKLESKHRDRNLLQRFPNETAHKKAREAALDDVRKNLKVSEQRLASLEKERKPLMDESEFYVGKQLPLKLKQAIDANDATAQAQRELMETQKAELVRINTNYDAELERLRRLWAGAEPGSLGPLATEPPASAPGRRSANSAKR